MRNKWRESPGRQWRNILGWQVCIRHMQAVQTEASDPSARHVEGCHYQDFHCLCTMFLTWEQHMWVSLTKIFLSIWFVLSTSYELVAHPSMRCCQNRPRTLILPIRMFCFDFLLGTRAAALQKMQAFLKCGHSSHRLFRKF